ncbi:MAG: HlyD family efflux transporter periplasmic adaptor subunit [Clostridiales bacterium]
MSIQTKNKLANLPLLSLDDTTVLTTADFVNSISATGIVESASSMTVYSTLPYTVQSVAVTVGDMVEEGQLLATLDSASIQKQIESQQTGLNSTQQSSAQQIKSAQDNYNAAKYALDSGLNATLISANSQVQSAYETYIKATENYQRYQAGLDAQENTTLLSQDAALAGAENAVDSAQDGYAVAQDARDAASDKVQAKQQELDQAYANNAEQNVITMLETELAAAKNTYTDAKSKLKATQRALDTAEASYENTKAQHSAALTAVDNSLADYATAVNTAYDNWQTARTALAATKTALNEQLQSSLNSLNSAKINGNSAVTQVGLRQLRADLADTKITAPVSGTITAVYAKVGGSGSGLLFVIEDISDLIVKTSIKGYDIGVIKTGMSVTIKSDATADQIFDGVITDIAPTAAKNNQGLTDNSKETIFDTEVQVLSQDTGLKIGMSTRLNYIIQEQSAVLSVPYDAVYQNQQGQNCVLTATPDDNGKYLLAELPIVTGIENDLDIVISGSGVSEGLRIVNQPDSLVHLLGQHIVISEQPLATANPMMDMMMGGY